MQPHPPRWEMCCRDSEKTPKRETTSGQAGKVMMLVLFTHFCKSRDGMEKSARTLIKVTEAQKEVSVPLLDLMPNYQNRAHKERY